MTIGRRRRVDRIAVLMAAAAALGVVAASTDAEPARSQDASSGYRLLLVDEGFAVAPGSMLHLGFVVDGDIPEIAPPTTTTTSTSTTTTTTTTTTTVPASTLPGALPQSTETPQDATTPPAAPPPDTVPVVAEPPGPTMVVRLRAHRAIERRSEIAENVDALAPVIDQVEFDLDDVSRVDEAGNDIVSINVRVDDRANTNAIDLPEPGVYPISVEITRDGQVIATNTTFVERVAEVTAGPFSLAVLASVDDVGSTPSDEQLASARQQLVAVAELAEQVTAPITVRIPPVLVSTLLADDAELQSRLATALIGDVVIAEPDLPLDPSSAAAAGLGLEFVRRLRDGENTLTQAFPRSIIQRGAWIVDAPLTADGASSLRDLGTQLLVMPFDRYLELPGNRGDLTDTSLLLSTTLPDDFPLAIAVVDPATVTVTADPTSDQTPTERAVRMMAEIAGLRQQLEQDRRSFVISTPEIGVPDAAVVVQLERLAAQHPDVELQPLASITGLTNFFFVDGDVVSLELDRQPGVDLGGRAAAVTESRVHTTDVASMLPDDDERPAQWERDLRLSLTTGVDAERAASIVADVNEDVARLRNAVLPPESFPFTVGGRRADIPLRFTNTADVALEVVVHLEADKLEFPVNDVAVQLPANTTIEVPIEVEARSNGQFPVRIELRTPAGNALTEPVELVAKVNNFSGLGRVVTVGALLVLATWWLTYLKRRRRTTYERKVDDSISRHPAGAS